MFDVSFVVVCFVLLVARCGLLFVRCRLSFVVFFSCRLLSFLLNAFLPCLICGVCCLMFLVGACCLLLFIVRCLSLDNFC